MFTKKRVGGQVLNEDKGVKTYCPQAPNYYWHLKIQSQALYYFYCCEHYLWTTYTNTCNFKIEGWKGGSGDGTAGWMYV